jgi:glutathione S-transferase
MNTDAPAIELYDYELSADSYKARLLLSILGVPYISRLVEFYPAGEHRSEWFLAINPRGDLPVIVDGGVAVADAQRVLVHVARNHDPSGRWYPRGEGAEHDHVAAWLAFAAELTRTCGAARLHDALLQQHIDVAACRFAALGLLRILDEHLWFGEAQGHAWLLARHHPTIADIACFPDVMLAEEGGIALDEFGAIRRWGDRVRSIPGFITMPGIFGLAAAANVPL